MKKIIVIIAFFAALSTAAAQDTIPMLGPKGNYHDNYWIISPGDTCYSNRGGGSNRAWRYTTSDTLTIYGIAASLEVMDTFSLKITELLRIYKRLDTAVTQLGNNLEVYMGDPPTYYMQQDIVQKISTPDTYCVRPVFPVYERYFNEPIAVTDSFYVGTYPSSGYLDYYVHVRTFCPSNTTGHDPVSLAYIYYHPDLATAPAGWYYFSENSYSVPYIYAILTPPDTTDAGVDTRTPLGRLTGVMPNPAAETANVVSSFGISRIEAYNMAGERVHDVRVPDGSLSATLDLRRWPVGAYILRIHTPQGVATKKLTVRR